MFSIQNTILADHAFYINLSESTDRHDNVISQIKKFNISSLDRFEALKDPLHQSSATKSHLAVFELADKNSYDTICVFEDDFQLSENLELYSNTINIDDYLSIFCEHINHISWDIILLGFNGKKPCIPISKHLAKNFKSTGAWAYLINKKTYQFILNNFNYYRDRLAIDDILPYLTYYGFNSYVANIPIVNHATGFISTLQPSLGPINYTQWIIGNYHRTIWYSLNGKEGSVENSLDKIYNNTIYSRNNIIQINNFDGNLNKLIIFIQNNFPFSVSFIEILDNYTEESIRYYLNVECPYLIHTPLDRSNINGLGNNIITVSI
jgi:GR25 family glycosyltransferase involved in LPS biosynthesis